MQFETMIGICSTQILSRINKKGKKYYYKVRLYVKDASGTIIQSTSLSKSNVAVRVYK